MFTRLFTPYFKPSRLCGSQCNIVTPLHRTIHEDAEMIANPYFDKYADKIANLQRTSPETLQARYEILRDIKKLKTESTNSPSETQVQSESLTRDFPNSDVAASSYTQFKKLNDLLKVEKLLELPKEDIETIWKEFHKNKNCIWATIPSETYKKIIDFSLAYPTFLYPLPRNGGYEFFVSQFQGDTCHLTPLLAYQTHKEDSPSCLSMNHYTELNDSKGVILMHGEYSSDALRVHEAQFLANQVQLYYTSDRTSKKAKLLWTFNQNPASFRHMDLVAELESALPT